MMWWAVWCVAVAATGAFAAVAPAGNALAPLSAIDWEQVDSSISDDDSMGHAVPPMGGRYTAVAPWFYLLDDLPRDSQAESGRVKRRMPSLSIDLPMSVLRHKLGLEQERKAQALRAAANRNFLNGIGKRGFQWSPSGETGRFY